MTRKRYTTQLQAGLGMIDETRVLLDLWKPGMSANQLRQESLESGRFPGVSARRLQNLVTECFAPRLLSNNGRTAEYLKNLLPTMTTRDLEQILLIYTCRANAILKDFICEVFWPAYSSGREVISNQDARDFVIKSNQQGLTAKPWSEGTVRRVAGYLTGVCADFGMLERGQKVNRKIIPFRTEPNVAIVLAYDLHFSGLGDNAVVAHSDWELLGMKRSDVITELRRLSLKGVFLVQSAGEVVRIGWQCKNLEELVCAISKG